MSASQRKCPIDKKSFQRCENGLRPHIKPIAQVPISTMKKMAVAAYSLVLGSSWRHGGGAVAFRAGYSYSCTTRIAPTSGPKGRMCNRRYSTRLLGFDPDSLHFVTTRSFPAGSFLGAIQRLFFDVRYARSSAVAHWHIGAACWLVTARLYSNFGPQCARFV